GLDRTRALLADVQEDPGALDHSDDPVFFEQSAVRLLGPIPNPRKFLGIGLNYRDHAEEQGARIPKAPILFAKFANSLIGPNDDIRYPAITAQLDYEAEL